MKKAGYLICFVLSINVFWVSAQKISLSKLPDPCFDLQVLAPIRTWDEGIPLGNGLLGGLLWGENNTIRLSLDRGDLWDERTTGDKTWWAVHTYQKAADLIARKKYDLVNEWWDSPYDGVTPTKLPAGRIEIKLPVAEMVKKLFSNLILPGTLVPSATNKMPRQGRGHRFDLAERAGKEPIGSPPLFSRCWATVTWKGHRIFHLTIW
jgi:hypothetical protein